jgi:hypothetical protein
LRLPQESPLWAATRAAPSAAGAAPDRVICASAMPSGGMGRMPVMYLRRGVGHYRSGRQRLDAMA